MTPPATVPRTAAVRTVLALGLLLASGPSAADATASTAVPAPESAAWSAVAPGPLAAALSFSPPGARPLVLDVRGDDEFAEGHVPGAVHIPHDRLAARLPELAGAKDREVVVYCRSGRRAALALETLKNAGFRRLAHLQGDYPGWVEAQAAGQGAAQAPAEPTSTGVAPPEVPE